MIVPKFTAIEGRERDDLLLRVITRDYNTTNQGQDRWQHGWGENLAAFNETVDLKALIPKYIRNGQPLRFMKQFVQPEDPEFERKYFEDMRLSFFSKWLHGFDNIYEFGCGSGYNIPKLAEMFPASQVIGLDWVQPSVDIITNMNLPNASGRLFDFFNPDYDLEVPSNSVFLTIGAIEQTGKRWHSFLEFIIQKKPKLICHIEPIYEWYDSTNLVDYTAMAAHQKKDFCIGWQPAIRNFKIHHAERSNIGSLFIEGYSQLVWSLT